VAPTLVLLHGFTQTRQSWRPVIAALGGRRRALAPDLPGHGTAAARPASFAACTGYVRALGGERFALAGYSMGGRIALHAAFAACGTRTRIASTRSRWRPRRSAPTMGARHP
jgi:pimeloyl-ACP methyl ester carboxylesterase